MSDGPTIILVVVDGHDVPDYLRRHPVPAPPIQRIIAVVDGHKVTWQRDGRSWCGQHGRIPCPCPQQVAGYATVEAVRHWWQENRGLHRPSRKLARQALPARRKPKARQDRLADRLATVHWAELCILAAIIVLLWSMTR